MEDTKFHTSVMLDEAVEYLNVREGEQYIDATVGGGGHSAAIISEGGIVLGVDQDPTALASVRTRLTSPTRLVLAQGNFREIDKIAREHGFDEASGVLFDLGISSHHLEGSGRGFSFRQNEPLDMRMDFLTLRVKGADLVNGLEKSELEELFRKYGEEPKARRIAKEISKRRKTWKIKSTQDLREVIEEVGGTGKTMARVWQALRIAVNDEINALKEALPKAIDLLKPGGRIVVISFHSLEDREVKKEFRSQNLESRIRILTQRPVQASQKEVQKNPRASSAKLRCAERI